MSKRYPAVTITRGIDVGDVPRTPTKQWFNLTLTKPRRILLEAASFYGFPIAFTQEQNGALIQNVYPAKNTETQQISSSSKVELGLHTETAFHRYKPTAVLLLCLRGDLNAVTTYADVTEIVRHLSPETLTILTKPMFTTSIDESFRTNGESDLEIVCSILKESQETPTYEICYDEALMKGLNEQATNALGELKQAIDKSIQEITLDTGDLLVMDNTRVIHGRLPFKARYDGTDRWLQRVFAINQLPPKSCSTQTIDKQYPSIVSATVDFVPIPAI
jgi:L-asparagine oxygenase